MAAETWLTYNGITLRNVLTKRFEQVAEYDASGTDLVCFRFSITVVGYLHAQNTNFGSIGPNSGAVSGGGYHSAYRSLLMEPRGDLRYTIGADIAGAGHDVLIVGPPGRVVGQHDAKNGPKPVSCNITQIVGSNVLEVEYSIDTWIVECRDGTAVAPADDAPNNTAGVLSNRWSCVDTIDQNMRTKRTLSGVLRVASSRVNPNDFRNWVVPRLQMGFRRDSMNFKVTPDGLHLEYTISDVEVTHSPPPPATSWSYTVTEESSQARTGQASLNLTLHCPRDVDKSKLVLIAVAIIKSRLYGGDFTKEHVLLKSLAIADNYGDNVNSITVNARVERVMEARGLIGASTANIGKPISVADLLAASPNYDRNRSRGNYPADSTEIEGPLPLTSAWHAYLQTPCNDDHAIADADNAATAGSASGPRVDYTLSGTITTSVGDPTRYTSSDHDDAIYTHYELESQYQNDEHNVMLPVAGQRYAQTPSTVTGRVVGLALNTTTRTIRILAQRVGKQPKLPAPKKGYTFGPGKAILMRHVVTPKVPDRTADGKQLHTVLAEYTYGITVPPAATDALPIGVNPWEDPAFNTHKTDTALLSGAEP